MRLLTDFVLTLLAVACLIVGSYSMFRLPRGTGPSAIDYMIRDGLLALASGFGFVVCWVQSNQIRFAGDEEPASACFRDGRLQADINAAH